MTVRLCDALRRVLRIGPAPELPAPEATTFVRAMRAETARSQIRQHGRGPSDNRFEMEYVPKLRHDGTGERREPRN